MQRKTLFAVFSVLVVLALAASPVFAITGNYVKDNEHPFVGLVVFYDANGEFLWRCSGSLISPTVLLTAGHCADTASGAVSARVYFQQDAGVNFNPDLGYDPVSGYPEFCAPETDGITCQYASILDNFGFTGSLILPNTHDVGLVILDQPIMLTEYGQLPTPNLLDNLATARGTKNVVFTASGYGLSYKNQPQSGKPNLSFRERLMAESTLVNLRSAFTDGYNLETQGNGSGRGGTCNGDSGGPMFYGPSSSNLIVGVTSFGLNSLCRGTDYAYRVDRPEVLDWINSHITQ